MKLGGQDVARGQFRSMEVLYLWVVSLVLELAAHEDKIGSFIQLACES